MQSKLIRFKTYIFLISTLLGPRVASADNYGKGMIVECRLLELADLTQGKFQVLDLKPAKRICYSEKESEVSSQIGPGCFVHMRRISKRDFEISSDPDVTFYSENADCNLKAGQTVTKQLSSYCCNVRKPIDCGSQEPEKNFCFGQKVFHEIKDFEEIRKTLLAKQSAFLKRLSDEASTKRQKQKSK